MGSGTLAARALIRWIQAALAYYSAHRRVALAVQLTLVSVTLGLCGWAVTEEWSKAEPLLANARLGYLGLAFATVAAYYLVFILGWMRILDAWGIRIPYHVALQAEMVSMLAKYLPGGVW